MLLNTLIASILMVVTCGARQRDAPGDACCPPARAVTSDVPVAGVAYLQGWQGGPPDVPGLAAGSVDLGDDLSGSERD